MEAAAGFVCQALQPRRIRFRPEADRVGDGAGVVQGSKGRLFGGGAADVVAVREQDDHAASLLAGEHPGGEVDRVPERRARVRADRERAERVVRVDRCAREGTLLRGVLAEGDERDPVAGRLRGDEGGCCRRGLGERLARHRARRVEREHHVLAAAEIDRLKAGGRATVLEQGRGRR